MAFTPNVFSSELRRGVTNLATYLAAQEARKQKMQDMFTEAMLKAQAETMANQQLLDSMSGGGGGGGIENIGGFRPTKFTAGGVTYENPAQKAQEEAFTAAEKEKQVNISKIKRLNTMADVIEKSWKETNPKKGGRGRISGLMSIPFSTFQATEQQQIDSSYRTFVRGMRAQLARAMGDVGNLSEPEQRAAMELVPSLGDNYETGIRKIQKIRDFVDAIKSGDTEKYRNILGIQNSISSSDFKVGGTYNGEKIVKVMEIK